VFNFSAIRVSRAGSKIRPLHLRRWSSEHYLIKKTLVRIALKNFQKRRKAAPELLLGGVCGLR
jgi:hypothetical protein